MALSVAAVPARQPAPRAGPQASGRPGDDFNERADWLTDVLGPHGWVLHHEAGGTHLRRWGRIRPISLRRT